MLEKHSLTYRIEWNLSGKPFLTKPGKLVNAVLDSIQGITGITPKLETGGGTSDGRFVALMGAEVVEFGPLNATIHKVNESVSCDDLAKCGEVYYQMIVNLLDKDK
ncbi:succinyl-diaminopimelate desuccinylase [Rodentibacter pneumotropicus]|nr:succinyl-diaminopimelate desuccinylase [Rodentibacter pneumotropicus]